MYILKRQLPKFRKASPEKSVSDPTALSHMNNPIGFNGVNSMGEKNSVEWRLQDQNLKLLWTKQTKAEIFIKVNWTDFQE